MNASRTPDPDQVRTIVRDGYAKVATRAGSGGGCCGGSPCGPGEISTQIGYTQAELANLPEGADLGLSCGNPGAIAALKPGERVLDLGAGGGFDAFLCGPKVGRTGTVIGVDMTPEMLALARKNLVSYRQRTGLTNVEFRLGEIEHLPVADASIDVVVSNCVLNLSPDKAQVWREIGRVLAPGGRVAISDLALLRPLPEEVRSDLEALVGCVAGAVELPELERQIRAAGLVGIQITPKPQYVRSMLNFQDPLYQRIASKLPAGTTAADFVTSVDVTAVQPARAKCC